MKDLIEALEQENRKLRRRIEQQRWVIVSFFVGIAIWKLMHP